MIEIPEHELFFKTSRSGGPGGQNVNKLNTRVTVFFDVANTACFSNIEKRCIMRELRTRVNKNGVMRVVSQRHRTQRANRQAAIQRLTDLLAGALKKTPKRRKTTAPQWARQRRLEEKKQRSKLKKQRSQQDLEI